MDDLTLAAYDRDAAGFASDWETQPAPVDLYNVVQRFFIPARPTADVGCGSGRDTAWLDENGYPSKGFDASEGLLKGTSPVKAALSAEGEERSLRS